jgi:gelsolin
MALFGSDVEYNIKEAAAKTEQAWLGAGTVKGLLVWRIEQFKVVPWPVDKYGQFHTGDSYIVLHTYCPHPDINPDKLAWDVHFVSVPSHLPPDRPAARPAARSNMRQAASLILFVHG